MTRKNCLLEITTFPFEKTIARHALRWLVSGGYYLDERIRELSAKLIV